LLTFGKAKAAKRAIPHLFWLSLLCDVYGIENPEQFISFDDKVLMDKANGFMDVVIPSTKVLIERKSLSVAY